MPSRRPARLVALVASLALVVAACASGASSPSVTPASAAPASAAPASAAPASGGAPAGAGSAVTIQNFSFGPATLSVPVGATVTWTNKDSTNHTVTADDGSFDSNPISSGQAFSQTFTKAGTYSYHCKIHPTMKATVTVG